MPPESGPPDQKHRAVRRLARALDRAEATGRLPRIRTYAKNYREGTIVAVPLSGSDEKVVALVIRTAHPGNIALICAFMKRFQNVDLSSALDTINDGSIKRNIIRSSDMGIRTGTWLLMGEYPGFKKEDWPLPIFQYRTGWCVKVSEQDFLVDESEYFSPNEERVAEGGIFGDRAAEIYFSQLV